MSKFFGTMMLNRVVHTQNPNNKMSNESFSFESLDPKWSTKNKIMSHVTRADMDHLRSLIGDYLYHGSSRRFAFITPQVRKDCADPIICFSPFPYIASLFCSSDQWRVGKGEYTHKRIRVNNWFTKQNQYDGLDGIATEVDISHNIKGEPDQIIHAVGYLYCVKSDKVIDKVVPYNRWSRSMECWYFDNQPVQPDKIITVRQTVKIHYDAKMAKEEGNAIPVNQRQSIFKAPAPEKYYRVTYAGIGVYEALKQNMSVSEWHQFKNSEAARWLPLPKLAYKAEYLSYFTERGFSEFITTTKPYMMKYLDETKLNVSTYPVATSKFKIMYQDEYQIVTDGKEGHSGAVYQIYGAILGCLGAHEKDVIYTITKKLDNDPWLAIIKSSTLLTREEVEQWHKWHVVDVDKKGVPYYFTVKDVKQKLEYVYYSDDSNWMPINTPQEIEKAKEAGRKKGLVEAQLDFDTSSTEALSMEAYLAFTKTGIFKTIHDRAKKHYRPVGPNSWEHIQQVFSQATRAVKFVDHRDLNPKEFAAILYHDSSCLTDKDKEGHNFRGAEIAKQELADLFVQKDLDEIVTAIKEHDGFDKWSSETGDVLATGDANPPDALWVLNKSYCWGIRKGLDHKGRITNSVNSIPKKYGSKGTMVYPEHYKKYFAERIKEMQAYFDNLTSEVAERDVME